eukprot:CAMPEP_0181100674 /NCGR_PEP_ID=MMETSP1071-20121207/13321_1 /TAXON_ID=35127 /ORGANISM="Thalassiosira sp., Strain NH16" /LENGTH=149 /DNA_ID=CAMNT_0023183423 /DNA_START=411 /DNA_END=859 /DNA_ORIENTATION=+
MQINIKTLTGRKQAFNFEPENQVLAVKQALQEKEGIQVDQIRLIFSGKQLSDDRTLESYSINAGGDDTHGASASWGGWMLENVDKKDFVLWLLSVKDYRQSILGEILNDIMQEGSDSRTSLISKSQGNIYLIISRQYGFQQIDAGDGTA